MSVDETSAETLCLGLQAKPFLKSCYSMLNSCISLMENKMSLAFLLDHLSIKENKEVHKAIQKHKFYCESLEMTDFLKSQGNHEDDVDKEAKTLLKLIVKNSFKDVWFSLARCDPNPDYQYVNGELPKEVTEVQQLFINSLKKIVTEKFSSYQKEETVPVKMDNQLNDKLVATNQVATNLNKVDSLTDACKFNIKDLKLKMEEVGLPEEACDESHLEKAKIRQASLQAEIDQLSIQINTLFVENRERERQIQEKTENVVDELENVIQSFDKNMEEQQAVLDAREAELRRDEEELRKLGKLYEPLEMEYNEVVERRWLAEEKRKEVLRILQLKTRAAIIAQAWWRGYRVRKAMREKNKKKSKKGKGKGKKTK